MKISSDAMRILVALARSLRYSERVLRRHKTQLEVLAEDSNLPHEDWDMAQHFCDMAEATNNANLRALENAKKAAGRFKKPMFKEIPEYGDLMPLQEWINCCESGGFVDYDGHGNLATADKCSRIEISPSQRRVIKYPSWATHIVWYNK